MKNANDVDPLIDTYPMGYKEAFMLLPLVVGSLLPLASFASRHCVARGVINQKGISWITTSTTAATTQMTRTTRSTVANAKTATLSSLALPESEKKKHKPGVRRKKQVTLAKVGKPKAPPQPEPAADTTTADRDQQPWYHAFTKGDVEYDAYMRDEWGIEKRGDVAMFEKLSLEGAQSGLSWLTILRKREAYRRIFFHFDPEKVAKMTQQDVDDILQMQPVDKANARDVVVRHRGKLEAVINNAKCLVQMQHEAGDSVGDSAKTTNVLDAFLWSFVQDKPILNRWNGSSNPCPSKTAESEAMSKALKKMGWKFVGPTTCYAMMQAVGMVIDHPVNSEEWKVAKERMQQRSGGYQDAAAAAATNQQ